MTSFLIDKYKNGKPKDIFLNLYTPNLDCFGRIQGIIKNSLELDLQFDTWDQITFSVSRTLTIDNTAPFEMWGKKRDSIFKYKRTDDRTGQKINPFWNYCEGQYIVELIDGTNYATADKDLYLRQEQSADTRR